MFASLLRGLGIGGAQVDTVLDAETLMPGGDLAGTITITGGSADQAINGITIDLMCRCKLEKGDETVYAEVAIASARLPGTTAQAGETTTIPFAFTLPHYTPLSVGNTRIFLRTSLDVPFALDPSDADTITVTPTPAQAAIFAAMEAEGMRLKTAEIEYHPHREIPFQQEFDFAPPRGRWRLEEVEIAMLPDTTGTTLTITADRRGLVFGGERSRRVRIAGTTPAVSSVRRTITETLDHLV